MLKPSMVNQCLWAPPSAWNLQMEAPAWNQLPRSSPLQEYRADIETSTYSGYRSVTFDTLGEGSRIQQTIVMRGSSFISRALLPVIRPLMQRDEMAALDNLADLIEASPSINIQNVE